MGNAADTLLRGFGSSVLLLPALSLFACGGIVERGDGASANGGAGGVASSYETLCEQADGADLNPCHVRDYAQLLYGRWWACSALPLAPTVDAVGVEFTDEKAWYVLVPSPAGRGVQRSDAHGLWMMGYAGRDGSCGVGLLMMDDGIYAYMNFSDDPLKVELQNRDDDTRLKFVAIE
jgi:hypothetical protein